MPRTAPLGMKTPNVSRRLPRSIAMGRGRGWGFPECNRQMTCDEWYLGRGHAFLAWAKRSDEVGRCLRALEDRPVPSGRIEVVHERVGDRLVLGGGFEYLDGVTRRWLEHGVGPLGRRAGVRPDLVLDSPAERLVERAASDDRLAEHPGSL